MKTLFIRIYVAALFGMGKLATSVGIKMSNKAAALKLTINGGGGPGPRE